MSLLGLNCALSVANLSYAETADALYTASGDDNAADSDELSRPLYSNLHFTVLQESDYRQHDRKGTDIEYNSGFDYVLGDVFISDVVWQLNMQRLNDSMVVSNGIGMLPGEGPFALGYNAFFDIDLKHGGKRLSIGTKYDDPEYLFNLSANAYFSMGSEDEPGEPVSSVDLRGEGVIAPQLQFHSAVEYFSGDNIQVSEQYSPTDDSYKLTAGIDYTPIELATLGVEASKVRSHEVGYGVYLTFSYDPWRPLAEQIHTLTDNDFGRRKLIPFSRSLAQARFY
jgi:hypothetical protein